MAQDYTQAGRPMRVDTVLDEDVLLLAGYSGTEAISRPFAFQLELLSQDPNVAPDELLRTPMLLSLELPDGEVRRIHGLVRRFVQLGRDDDLVAYRAEIVPWLWFLALSYNCKIFQEMKVPDIVLEVFKSQGYSDVDVKLSRDYPEREYCVQYRETDLNFVSRLLEEEGIFYYFEHSENGHVLTLTDSTSFIAPCLGPEAVRMASKPVPEEDVVLSLQREHAVHVGMVTLRDYDFLQPALGLETSMAGNGREEMYDYPGKYTAREEGERYARIRLEAEEALQQVVRGSGSCRAFQSGRTFDLREHYRSDANQTYMLLEVNHRGRAGDYRSRDTAEADYRNEFLAIPNDVPYRPPALAAKPHVAGSQTAVVVGKSGEEIWVDKYGRIKVQFHWDRDGRHDENSSCWVRVATPWGGKGWGGVSLPRIGNEVIVEFLEGDPDRPIVTGSVYNADQMPPFELPGSGIEMGMKSRSSPGGGGYNQITMVDTKGKERITIHAQYDMSTTVLHDDTQAVKNDRKITVDGTHTETIQKDTTISVTDGAQTNTVKNTIKVESETASIEVKAATEIKLEVGASSLVMKADGTIKLKGVDIGIEGAAVAVKGSAKVAVKGGVVTSEADGLHQTKGGIVLSEGAATNTVKGGMVMLNP